MRSLLWTKNFTLLWGGQSISGFGSELTLLVYPLVAIGLLEVPTASVPLLALASGLGTVVGLSVLAPLADHPRQRTLLAILDAVRFGALGVTAISLATMQFGFEVMCLSSFVIAACTALYDSAFAALIPSAVAQRALPSANAWFGGVRSAANIGAGGAGAILLHLLAAPALLLLDALTYCVAAVSLIGLDLPVMTRRAPERTDYLAGFRALRADRVQRSITAASAHFNLFTTAIQSILVVFSVRTLGLTSLGVGIAMSIGGVIGLLGIVLTDPIHRRFPLGPVLAVTFALPGLATILLTAVPRGSGFPSALLAVVAVALLNGLWSISVIINIAGCETLRQIEVPRGMLGRFSAAVRLVTWGVDPLGALLAAALLLVVDLPLALLLLGAGLVVSSAWVLTSRRIMSLQSLSRAVEEGVAGSPTLDTDAVSAGTPSLEA